MSKYLLKGGTVVTFVQGESKPRAYKADVLVEGNSITRIEENIAPQPGVEVFDCENKWITPGFVDTHRYSAVVPEHYLEYLTLWRSADRHLYMTVSRGDHPECAYNLNRCAA